MKIVITLIISFFVFGKQTTLAREIIDLTDNWKLSSLSVVDSKIKSIDKIEDKQEYISSDFDDGLWKKVKVPHNWYAPNEIYKQPILENNVGWYRKVVNIPKEWDKGRTMLHFEAVDREAVVWVNGEKCGEHQGCFTSFEFDITRYVKYDEENLIVVKVYDNNSYGTATTQERSGYGTFFVFHRVGGMWDKVWLENRGNVYTSDVQINPNINNSEISVDFSIINPLQTTEKLTLKAEVSPITEENKKSGENTEAIIVQPDKTDINIKVKMKEPIYWSPENPYLYNLKLILKDKDGKVIDEKSTKFGFREFIVKNKKFYLNGKEYYLLGGQQILAFQIIGNSKVVEEMVKNYVKLGYRIIRVFSELPKEFYDYADKYGLMLYQKWSTPGPKDINHPNFMANIDELKDRMKELYNHPSVVMWTFSEEVWYDAYVENQTKTYDIVRPLDKQNRPITMSTGQYCVVGLPSVPVKGNEFIDLHNYQGISSHVLTVGDMKKPWTFIPYYIEKTLKRVETIYKKLDVPVIIGEGLDYHCTSWDGVTTFPKNHKITVEEYIQAITSDKGYHKATPTFAKVGGIRKTTLPGSGWNYEGLEAIEVDMAKKWAEEFRRLSPIVSGIFPWVEMPKQIVRTVYQPLLAVSDVIYNDSFIVGNKVVNKIYVINNSINEYRDLEVLASINKLGSKERINVHKEEPKVKISGVNTIVEVTEEIVFSEETETGKYQIVYEVKDREKIISTNKYEIYVLSKKESEIKINNQEPVALYEGKFINKEDIESTRNILNKLGMKYKGITDVQELKNYKRIVMPVNSRNEKWENIAGIQKIGKGIRDWMEGGGEFLCLEQSLIGPLPWLNEISTIRFEMATNLMDPAVSEHPIFNGLDVDNFNTWNGDKGIVCKVGIKPLSVNMLGCAMDFFADEPMLGLTEAKVGKGRYIMSQVLAVSRYGTDGSATKYVNNLISYLMSDEKVKETVELIGEKPIAKISKGNLININLRPYCNMGFADEVEEDGKGGWTDQGPNNDMRELPVGPQDLLGIPFDIINPAENRGKSCIVVGKKSTPWAGQVVSGIKIGEVVKRLFILHTTAWQINGGKYIFNYEDGTKEEVVLEKDKQIGSFWNPNNIKEARVAWRGKNPMAAIGFHLWIWNNPYPEKKLETIDMICRNDECVFILLGISAEK